MGAREGCSVAFCVGQGGFVTDYEGGIHFATVHGAGHMSPQWRPEAAYNMLKRFLDGVPI